jgi:glycosyltransferase involved in cell wall biosynthesis
LKLLQICNEGNTGSVGTIAESLGTFVIEKGWESYIAFARFERGSNSKLIRIGSELDVITHGIESRIFDNDGFCSRNATKRLINKIEDIKPDLIHLHHLHGYFINVEILFNFLLHSNIPVVWTFHDCWSFTGHCTYFDYVDCDKWKSHCNSCPQKHEYPKSIFLDNSKNNFSKKRKLFTSISRMTVVSVSNWLDKLVEQSFFKDSNHLCIYNGIDLELFKPINNSDVIKNKYNINKKFVILGVATTWDRRKGLNDFIELSKYIKNEEIIVLVGLSKEQRRILPSNVLGLPRTENRIELAHLFAASDVFLNLSTEETFGLTTAEALASGTPAIVYNKTASPELVNSKTGFVVEKNDYLSIIEAIDEIKKNKKEFYKSNCRLRAFKLFNSKDIYNSYFELYNNMIFDL